MNPRWLSSRSTLERGQPLDGRKRYTLAFAVVTFVKILALAFVIVYAARMLLSMR